MHEAFKIFILSTIIITLWMAFLLLQDKRSHKLLNRAVWRVQFLLPLYPTALYRVTKSLLNIRASVEKPARICSGRSAHPTSKALRSSWKITRSDFETDYAGAIIQKAEITGSYFYK